jgi:hypothetical protein
LDDPSFTEARVRVTTVAPHATQIFQVLDVTLFRVLNPRPRYKLPFENEKKTVEPNIWGTFQAIGFEFEFDREAEPF